MQKADRGRTRWRQALMLFIPAILGVLALTVMTIQGVLPLHLAISGQQFKLTSNGAAAIAPQGLSAYPSSIKMKDGSQAPVLMAGLPEAELTEGMCISLVLTLPIVGTNTLQISSSGNTTVKDMEAAADKMYIRGASLSASTNNGEAPATDAANVDAPVLINKDASELNDLSGGPSGALGLEVPGLVKMGELRASASGATISGTAQLNGIGIPKIGHGSGTENGECY
ncbi:DUF6230 family protein [Antrihabitans sp. YC2-6]|uniref:DUF6230 family protein n=1 Tax=Antrihabitans sp. YC2-6 TaxID=2799498 RepID=UPI0018F785A2|nr:DUF6230 family protein [Antrihabitans sp. YC2-6]MBJ8348446.1 hypothetical protein [Antrihabitans sp. YC2-6]